MCSMASPLAELVIPPGPIEKIKYGLELQRGRFLRPCSRRSENACFGHVAACK
jgi:hypothetical protein